jgi:hypothetical protein
MKRAFSTLALFIIATGLAWPQQISFKLLGGLTRIRGNDYNTGITGEMEFLRDNYSTVSGDYQKFKDGANLQAEIITHWGRTIAVGFGGGYYEMGKTSQVTLEGMSGDVPFTSESAFKPKISVIPFYLNLYLKIFSRSRFGLDLFAGPVVQIAQFSFERRATSTLDSLTETETFKGSNITLGGQAGIGLSIEFARGVALIVDGFYRYAKVSNFTGNWLLSTTTTAGTTNTSSSDYYYWYYNYSQGKTYHRIGFFDSGGPSGDGISGVRKADFDLTGFTGVAGLKINF